MGFSFRVYIYALLLDAVTLEATGEGPDPKFKEQVNSRGTSMVILHIPTGAFGSLPFSTV